VVSNPSARHMENRICSFSSLGKCLDSCKVVRRFDQLTGFTQFAGESRTSRTPCWGEVNSNCRATSKTVSTPCKSVTEFCRKAPDDLPSCRSYTLSKRTRLAASSCRCLAEAFVSICHPPPLGDRRGPIPPVGGQAQQGGRSFDGAY
jgi:hypothetical protein